MSITTATAPSTHRLRTHGVSAEKQIFKDLPKQSMGELNCDREKSFLRQVKIELVHKPVVMRISALQLSPWRSKCQVVVLNPASG